MPLSHQTRCFFKNIFFEIRFEGELAAYGYLQEVPRGGVARPPGGAYKTARTPQINLFGEI